MASEQVASDDQVKVATVVLGDIEILPPKKYRYRHKKIEELDEADRKRIHTLAWMHCTVDEIAAVVECHRDTIYANFSDILREGKEKGKGSLKHAMFQKAVYEKDTKMQIWLSKQYLGMKENHDQARTDGTFQITMSEIPE